MYTQLRSKWRAARMRRKVAKQASYFNALLPYLAFNTIDNRLTVEARTITFVVPAMMPFSGGQTSILRLGSALVQRGLDVRYVCYQDQDANTMRRIAQGNLASVLGSFHPRGALEHLGSDVWVASVWETAYLVRGLKGYKAYFAQDYEPYFYPYGERFLLARQTYDMGLHVITLGAWIKQVIAQQSPAPRRISTVSFPYEKAEYSHRARDFALYPAKTQLKLAVYIKEEEKRAPNLLPLLLGQTQALLRPQGIALEVSYFGGDQDTPYPHGRNLGRLDKPALLALYHASDLGMVASLTNISLIPYEMLAAGLPLIEFTEGSFSAFFEPGTAILTSMSPAHLAHEIVQHVRNPARLARMMTQAQAQLQHLSWAHTAAEFHQHLMEAVEAP
jgi:O-antigen biosynthesis protein